ncbi:MAG TPA: PfkB family carbohydrate kinase [Galbitalea sp.]|nr:PfkB family carbohydrate kinase [Galbitalea sp.]
MTLLVLGSANRDYTVLVEKQPAPGETVLGGSLTVATGGKGANQAVAAARAGAEPIFIGAVGTDSVGGDILADLAARGVDVTLVSRSSEPSGVALITVSAGGENSIVVAPGANATLEATATAAIVAAHVVKGSVLLCQLEISPDVVSAAASEVEKAGGRFVLNLSPSRYVSPRLLALADPLVLNENEATDLASSAIDGPADAQTVAKRLLATSRSVVITLGADGAIVADSTGVSHAPAVRVPVVDTTGAGDAFAGALAAGLAAGDDLATSVNAGIVAGAAAVQHLGAQPPL